MFDQMRHKVIHFIIDFYKQRRPLLFLFFAWAGLSGCSSIIPQSLTNETPKLTWDGTREVTFIMAIQQETYNGIKLNGMVKDSRGRRHRLFDSHIDAQFIGEDGSVIGEKCAKLRPLPRPRVIYRLARFSLSLEAATDQVDEYRLYFHDAKHHCSS